MLVVVGAITVIASILIGFTFAGGEMLVLFQWSELLIIIGAATGSLLISTPMGVLKKMWEAILDSFRSNQQTRQSYLQLLKTFNDLFVNAQREGLRALEEHVENPLKSPILSKNRVFVLETFYCNFFCDAIRLHLAGGVTAYELEKMMDAEIETFEIESRPVSGVLLKVADSLPGLGIVAAVLGIIVTMSSIDQGAAYVGRHVAAALVGTFLGVLLCYGFMSPLASKVEHALENRLRYLETIKTCIIAYVRGHSPILAVEMARRAIPSENRPSFIELEQYIRGRVPHGKK
jgi:chemotaxis protein MotA